MTFLLATVCEHHEGFVSSIKVRSSVRDLNNLRLDQQRLDVFALSAANALFFEVPKQIVISPLLNVLLIDRTDVC